MPANKKKYMREYMKKYMQRPANKLKRKEYKKRPGIKEYQKAYQKEYYQHPEVKKRQREYYKEYYKHNPVIKKRGYLREKVRGAVIHQKHYISTIHKLIGCDVPTARAHIEAQFEDWMTWENYGSGKDKWCIDHIVPLASIDIFNEEEVKRIFHYTNMQPMEFCKNSEKGCRET